MGKNQVTIFAVIYVELMQQGARSSKELGLFSNFILEMDCCIYIDTTVVSKNIYFLNKQFLSWDSFLLVCLFMLEEGVLGAGSFFLNKVEAMECIRPFCATTVSIPLTILRL